MATGIGRPMGLAGHNNIRDRQSGMRGICVEGYCEPKFKPLSWLFRSLLPKDRPGGAALAVYHRGRCVVDIWDGTADEQGRPWKADTLALSYSTTKGVVATLAHILVDQGVLHYDDPVARYWPEFAQGGKENITLRQLLCHEAGLYDVHGLVDDAREMLDWDLMVKKLEQAEPRFEPGSANGYHGLTYGWLVGETLQRATGRSLQDLLRELVVEPLGLDGCYIGLPEDQHRRRAHLIGHPAGRGDGPPRKRSMVSRVQGRAMQLAIRALGNRPEDIRDALMPKGIGRLDFNQDASVEAAVPAANGLFTARSLARLYGALAEGGKLDGTRILSPLALQHAGSVQNTRIDKVIPVPMNWRLGYHRVFTVGPRTPHAFGHFGYGGSGAWCDPSRQLSLAYVVNHGAGSPFGDSRLPRLNTAAIYSAAL